jgi:ADP-ribose pyrophosphatase
MPARREIRPWPRVSSRAVSDHRVIKVRVDTLTNPRDGKTHPRVVIEAPDWVTIIPITVDDEVVLVRQYRFGIADATLEVPGGIVDAGEAPLAAAARELEEETGYVALELVPLGWVHPNPALQDNRSHCFLALGCTQVHQGKLDPTEDIAVERVPRTAIPELISSGQITHSLVVAGFYREQLWRAAQRPAKQKARPR